MLANQALNTNVQPLSGSNSLEHAREQMEALDVEWLPVVDSENQKLIGQLNLHTIKQIQDDLTTISEIELEEPVKVYENQHLFEVIRLMLLYEMRLLPIVDDNWVFMGVVTKQEVLEALSHMLNLAEYGSVITIELDHRDLSLTEIVHLIEVEGAKILGITVERPEAEEQNFMVSIKLNLQDVSRVNSALRRHGYSVVTESQNESFGMDLETRADALLKYLDM